MAEARAIAKDLRFAEDRYIKAVAKHRRLREAAEEAAKAAGLPAPHAWSGEVLETADEIVASRSATPGTRSVDINDAASTSSSQPGSAAKYVAATYGEGEQGLTWLLAPQCSETDNVHCLLRLLPLCLA